MVVRTQRKEQEERNCPYTDGKKGCYLAKAPLFINAMQATVLAITASVTIAPVPLLDIVRLLREIVKPEEMVHEDKQTREDKYW